MFSFIPHYPLQSLVCFLRVNRLQDSTHLSTQMVGLLASLTNIKPADFTADLSQEISVHKIISVCHLAYLVSKSTKEIFKP